MSLHADIHQLLNAQPQLTNTYNDIDNASLNDIQPIATDNAVPSRSLADLHAVINNALASTGLATPDFSHLEPQPWQLPCTYTAINTHLVRAIHFLEDGFITLKKDNTYDTSRAETVHFMIGDALISEVLTVLHDHIDPQLHDLFDLMTITSAYNVALESVYKHRPITTEKCELLQLMQWGVDIINNRQPSHSMYDCIVERLTTKGHFIAVTTDLREKVAAQHTTTVIHDDHIVSMFAAMWELEA